MFRPILCVAFVTTSLLTHSTLVADEASSGLPETKVLFEDDFEGRSTLGEGYRTGRGMEAGWSIRDGVLFGKQIRDDHGSTMRKQMEFGDLYVSFDFRFNGGSRFNFVIDDNNDKSVHAGHVARASLSPKRISISDDKLGSMNLEVRQKRQQKSLPAEEQKELDALLARTQASAEISAKRGEWHQLELIIRGTVMTVHFDGNEVVSLDSPGFAHPTKTQFGMTVNGTSIDFDNLKVFATE
ncbi:putative signal peptide protein [Rhodopirellula islandica]|uniref:Signal peptide protein n=1 Tax=Rhodopirellula islandica TaxID=595434 RepID=A0A0J1EP08_RHOIS|nr:family 16 glycoside hydrolase [Rhodopirellula islandica]KLU07224.1 putative signal peptide protein [Rhodopirellula islandica]